MSWNKSGMGDLVRRVVFWVIRRLLPAVVTPQQKVIFVGEGPSGCNAYALLKYFQSNESKINTEFFDNSFLARRMTVGQYYQKIRKLSTAKVLVTTHGPVSLPNRAEISTWHSPLFKSILAMENPSHATRLDTNWRTVDNILSYSQLYSSLMVACTLTNPYRHLITGAPRNDFLYDSDGRGNLERISQTSLDGKRIIFFVPTFRMGYSKSQGSKKFDNLFGFPEFNADSFNEFLSKNNLLFVYKLHPNEEKFYSEYTNLIDPDLSCRLNNDVLSSHSFDLYQIINAADVLITDYSGIFIDFLLLDRPIIFTPVDLESYAKTRSFLYGPFDEWTPGRKVLTQSELVSEVSALLEGGDDFKQKRRSATKIWHDYQDNKSSERSSEVIKKLLFMGEDK
jgi:CDP-glycerol glycerophosphotransferase (TagB/SpsB family)